MRRERRLPSPLAPARHRTSVRPALALVGLALLPLAAAPAIAAAPATTDEPPLAATPAPQPAETPPAAGATTVPPVRPRRVTLGERGAIELGDPQAQRGRWKGFPISLSLRDAPLPEVLRSFARLVGANLVLDPGVRGEVTVELVDVPWDQALYVILRSHGMGAEIDGKVWLVQPR
jgi:hypothetical protein